MNIVLAILVITLLLVIATWFIPTKKDSDTLELTMNQDGLDVLNHLTEMAVMQEPPALDSQPASRYKYKYDISPRQYPNTNCKDGISTQMKYDIYGLYGSGEDYVDLSEDALDEVYELKDDLTREDILGADLSRIHPQICWIMYHKFRDMNGEC